MIADALPEMLRAVARLNVPFEIVVCENGSRDDTLAIARRLAAAHHGIRIESLPDPDYGHALQHGIQVAAFDKVVIFNVDFWSAQFLETALAGLEETDMVVGSKVMGTDSRPFVRRVITRCFNVACTSAMTSGKSAALNGAVELINSSRAGSVAPSVPRSLPNPGGGVHPRSKSGIDSGLISIRSDVQL